MADSITQAPKSAVAKAPMAQGMIPKPEMRRMGLKLFKRWAPPLMALTLASYVGCYFALYDRHKKQYENYVANLNPDKLYDEMREYGVFKSVKASWQE